MLIVIITWSSLVIALLALGGAVFGFLQMRKEDAMAAARGKSILMIAGISAFLFFILFGVGLYRLRSSNQALRIAPVAGTTPSTNTQPGLTVTPKEPGSAPGGVTPPPSTTTAELIAMSPPEGVRGRTITIVGRGFGITEGSIQFIDKSGVATPAKLVVSSECTPTPWGDTAILVTVPDLPSAEYQVSVTLLDKTILNRLPFRITNLGTRVSICRVDPEHGIPNATTVTIVGEDLGSSLGKVLFGEIIAPSILSWEPRRVTVRVPERATTGTVRVVTAGGIKTNELTFSIGQCTQGSCRAGEACCGDGLCRKDGTCPTSGACRYRWYFSTGTAVNLPCGALGTCPTGFLCNVATKLCIAKVNPPGQCTTNAQCASGTYCERSTGKCLDGTPRLTEEQGCTNTVQSPTPYRGRIDACINARFGARYSVPLDATTFEGDTIELRACGTGVDFIVDACRERVQGTIDHIPGQDGPRGFLYHPTQSLQPETWYSMLVHTSLRSVAGVSLGNESEWHVRTGKTSCSLDHIEVTPNRSVVIGVGSEQSYRALATATNCNVISHAGPWVWTSKDENRAMLNPKTEEATVATGRAVTLPEGVTLESMLQGKKDTGALVIRLEAPKLIEWWPACAAACRNAELGLRFSVPMRLASFTEKTVRLEACADATCAAVTPVAITGFAGEEGNTVVVFRPSKGVLAPGMTYRAILLASQLLSRDGAPLAGIESERKGEAMITNDRYSWTFRSLDTRAVCAVDHVAVAPEHAVLHSIFSKQDFSAVPRSKGDACDSRGQRLIASGYAWAWASSQEQVAALVPDQAPEDPFVQAEARGSGQTAVSAETGGARGIGNLSVVCDAVDDRSCSADQGVGIDQCCYPRPKVLINKPESGGACRNGVIQIAFDQPIDEGSLKQGVIIEQETAGVVCGAKSLVPVSSKPSTTSAKPSPKIFCPVPATMSVSESGQSMTFTPSSILPKETKFRVRVLGRDSESASVKNRAGVALDKSVTWNFTTSALICQITTLRVYRDPLVSPTTSDTFLCARRDNCVDDTSNIVSGNQHHFRAEALDQEGRAVGATFVWSSRDRRVADIVANKAEVDVSAGDNGKTAIDLVATGTSTSGGRGTFALPIDVTACANPWPPQVTQGATTLWEPFADTAGAAPTNFSTWYCRDRGGSELDDDLPALSWPPRAETGFEQDPKKRDLIKGFLFQVVGGGEADAIGFEVFKNNNAQNALRVFVSWWEDTFCEKINVKVVCLQPPPPPSGNVNGYPSYRDGRTVYVNALNVLGNQIFTHVYLLAYGLGASEDTIAIAKQLEQNWRFTTTVTDEKDRAALQRDVMRALALKSMRAAIDARGAPKLEAGSFIPGLTFSTWPVSWGRLAGAVSASFSTDPVNRFEGCTKPFDGATCWNPVRKKNEALVKQFKCPTKALAYGYKVDASAPGGYILATNFEYDGPGSFKRDPVYRSLDGLLGSGVCTK